MKENFRKNSIDFLHHALLQFQEVASPKQGDQYIGYWETYQIDRVSYNKGELILYCTKARNHTMSKAQQYICRRVEHG